MPRSRAEMGLLALAIAYFAAVVLGVFLDYEPGSLASSPDHLFDGEVWRLLTSALAVEGRLPLVQVAIAALAAFGVIRIWGAIAWWGAVLTAHIGSAVVVYTVIGILDALGVESAERASRELDYGVSIVLTGSLGALFATGLRRRHRQLAIVAAAGVIAFIPLSLDWYGAEHPLGFLFGALFIAWWARRGTE